MGTHFVLLVGAAAFAALAGYFLAKTAIEVVRRKSFAALAVETDRERRLAIFLAKGFAPLFPVAKRLLEIPPIRVFADRSVAMLEEREVKASDVSVVSVLLFASVSTGLIGGLVSSSLVFGLAVAFLCIFGAIAYVRNIFDKRALAMREQIPDALRCMGTCFRSGLSLPQTLQQTAKECGGALGNLFGIAAKRLKMGSTVSDALSVLRSDEKVPELSFVAVALDVQHQSGGSIAPVLETARESVASELDLMRSLRVQTAQAKLSASIVTVMPFVLVALFSLMSPGFLAPFFSSLAGMALLVLAISMQLAGVLAVRHMLKIEAG